MPIDVGLSKKELKQYSISRAIEGLITQDQSKAGLEFDVSYAIAAKTGKPSRGIYIPNEVASRALSTGVAAEGGDLVETEHNGFIDVLRDKQIVNKMGATILSDLVGNVAIPRMTTGSSVGWIGEDESALEADPAFDQVTLTPKTVAGYVDVTRRLVQQSSVDVERLIFNDFAKGIARGVDLAAIAGTGASNEPTGIINTTGVNSVSIGTNGGAIDWQKVVELETAVAADNGILDRPAYLTNYKVAGAMKAIEKAVGTGKFLWEGEKLNGYDTLVSNAVPGNGTKGTGTDLSTMIFGSWENLIVGEWGVLDLTVDPISHALSGKYRLIAFYDCDIAVRHPESFCICTDIATS